MNTKNITRISLGGLFLATILLSLVPVVQTAFKVREKWNGVPPSYIDDDLYYYARIKEVIDGHLFLGNPYFMEYRDARSVAFFVPDWLAVVPLILGLPFDLAIVFNFMFWSLLFVLLAYLVARAADLPPPYSAVLAFMAYGETYWVILRPVVMQEVFPFSLLFILALLVWLRNPSSRRSVFFLILASVLPFYIYPYLWQIVLLTLGFVFLHLLVQKKWSEVKILLLTTVGIGVFSLPVIVYTMYQIQAPFYWETIGRIGLVLSHWPTLYAYQYGRWTLLLIVLYVFFHRWFKPAASITNDPISLAAIYSGLGLLVMSVSNIFTGQELETAQHTGRFITLWLALFFPIFLWKLYQSKKELLKLSWLKIIIIGLLSLACLGFLAVNLTRSLPFQKIESADAVTIQEYAAPLNWLNQQETSPVVVWADEQISRYIPILTKHYVFWAGAGGLHLMPTKEVEDRFLASRIGTSTADEIFEHYREFEGAGSWWRYLDYWHKKELRCLVGSQCESGKTFRDWVGNAKLDSLVRRQAELKGDISAVIKKYHVSYLIADKGKGEDNYFKALPGAKEVWQNNRFVIYKTLVLP
ncbi:MAG: hypothetical protein AAB645_00490 [Patescibacteria group bacterium]